METKTTVQDEPYAYFQPGGLIYLLSSDSNKRMKELPSQQGGLQVNEEIGTPVDPPVEPQNPQQITDQQSEDKADKDDKDDGRFDKQVDELIKWSNEKAGEDLVFSRRKERELFFPGTKNLPDLPPIVRNSDNKSNYESPKPEPRGAFSLIPVEVRTKKRDGKNPDGFVDVSRLVELSLDLHNSREDEKQPFRGPINLELVAPNWLSSPTSETGGGGGPGSRPVPFAGPSSTTDYELHFSSAVEGLCPLNQLEWGKGVKIAILDTAPCLHELVWAYEFYHKVNPEKRPPGQEHLLLESLLRQPDPQDPRPAPLTLHSASSEDLMRMRSVHLRDHNYNMTDHGLFVAGIIHSIAPAAEIHLYEVLNSEGVGDLESIARGLWKVAEQQYEHFINKKEVQPLVVNCSLTLNIPLEGDPDSPNTAQIIPSDSPLPIAGHRLTDLDNQILGTLRSKSDWVERGGKVIMWICDLLFLCGARVIAAAGNDWRPAEDPGRPQARFLAAFPSVQGVGALPRDEDQNPVAIKRNSDYEVSSYSDVSDVPGTVGVATLGGEPGEGKGVLGLFIGEFPEPEPKVEVEKPVPTTLPLLERIRRGIITFLGGFVTLPPLPAAPLKNENHWAWWAGTSFATPILSGVIAAVLSKPNPPPTTEGAIVKLYDDRAIEEAKTTYEEDLLKVRQGP
jgi:hypothetical protein